MNTGHESHSSIDWNAEMAIIRQLRSTRTRVGPGVTPAVVVVDFQRAFTEHDQCSRSAGQALSNTATLLDAARHSGIPVIYLVMILDSLDDRMLAQRMRSSLTEVCERGNPWTEIHGMVAPAEGDHIIEKTVASGFYNTELESLLTELQIDEIIVAGTSTSGCVRATVTDAAYRNFRVSVVEDCVDDFRALSAQASLWDIQDRFGDVVTLTETLERIRPE